MLKIQKREQAAQPVTSFKIGDTFVYNNTLYMVIEADGVQAYLNMATACTERNISYMKSVPQVQCLVTYNFI